MPTYLLDASGLCKRYFTNEVGSDLINDLFNDKTSPRYLLNFTILEILNAIYRVHTQKRHVGTLARSNVQHFCDILALKTNSNSASHNNALIA